jgi:hypothetical protein
MPNRPVEILALSPKLHELFDGRIPPGAAGDEEQREKDFLSRALAAFAVHKLGGATLDEASNSVVDGGGDGGIDAIYFSPTTNTLWMIQSKYTHAGLAEPDLGEVSKFKAGVENLLDGKFEAFETNKQWKTLRPQVEANLKNAAMQARAVLCYSGLSLISEDRKRLFETLKRKVSKDQEDDYFEFRSVNLTTLNDWVTGGDDEVGVESVDLEIVRPGLITTPYETIYGLVTLESVKLLYKTHGKKLIAANIRGFKGRTDVNEGIQKTLGEEASLFHYLNNGLTAYCSRMELNNIDRSNADKKRITAKGFAIINGAQTLVSIDKCLPEPKPEMPPVGHVFIKIISLEKCEDDRAFANRISQTANLQNHVGLKDFAAAYELHAQIARTLTPHGIQYHYKIDEDTPEPDDQNCSIEEALTACACLKNDNGCDFLTRVSANRDSLRSLEMVFPSEEPLRSRHERVFPPDLSARTLWRAVQTQRIVLQVMRDSAKASTGALKTFFANARWIILCAVFNKNKPEDGEALALDANEQASVSAAVSDYADRLLAVCVAKGIASYETVAGQQVLRSQRDFQSIFKTQGDCQILFGALKAEIWKPKIQTPPVLVAQESGND